MASNRSVSARGESLLGWAAPHNAMDKSITGTLSGKVGLRQSREASQWLYVLALLCLISLLAFLYLALASYVAQEMETTATLEATIQSVKEENNKLRLAIVLKEDLTWIQQEARKMGFAEAQRVEYLEVVMDEEAVAATSMPSPAHQLSPADAPSAPGWWDKIVRQFRDWITSAKEAKTRDGS
ncbi:MAG: hypothetical protein H5T63_06675 [Chloroflexi bacterium]|nr:hypothetical protein [Chloroflexota bacterium]